MSASPNWDVVSDAELARAAAAGDRGAFAGIYDRYADRLHDFCVGIVHDRDAAADCVQDVFCTAATQLSRLRDPDKLRCWLYTIARNETFRCLRERRRERVCDDMPEEASGEPGPETMAARTELAELVADAAGGLSDRDRTVLELTYRHGLSGPELAGVLGVSHTSAKKMAERLRDGVDRSLGALLVSRHARHDPNPCAELRTILENWDGQFTVLIRKRIARHIESCTACDEQRTRLLNPVALLGGAPLFIPAPAWLRDRTLDRVALTSATQSISPSTGEMSDRTGAAADYQPLDAGSRRGVDSRARRPSRRALVAAAMVAAAVLAAGGVTLAWRDARSASVTPAVVSKTTTQSTSTPTPAVGASSVPQTVAPTVTFSVSPSVARTTTAQLPEVVSPATPPAASPVAPISPVRTPPPPPLTPTAPSQIVTLHPSAPTSPNPPAPTNPAPAQPAQPAQPVKPVKPVIKVPPNVSLTPMPGTPPVLQ